MAKSTGNRVLFSGIEPRNCRYVACEEMDFVWDEPEIAEVKTLWGYGWPLNKIADRIGRDPDELAILIIDLARHKQIKQREGGAYGFLRDRF